MPQTATFRGVIYPVLDIYAIKRGNDDDSRVIVSSRNRNVPAHQYSQV